MLKSEEIFRTASRLPYNVIACFFWAKAYPSKYHDKLSRPTDS